jgi:glycosyltransferase involved in cell wall biosynthesis
MKSAPKISAVMPFYNREKYIGQAIQSILDQTFTDFELILVDDGSTDRSNCIIDEYAKKDPRIRIIRNKKNYGIARSRNVGMKNAQADIIAVVDSDDVNLPERFSMQYEYLLRYPDISIVGTHAFVIDEDGQQTGEKITYLANPDMISQTFFHLGPFLQPTTMYRKKNIMNIGGYREEYSLIDDMDLYYRLFFEGHKGANIDLCLVEYRHHDGATGVFLKEKREKMLQLKKEMVRTYKPHLGIKDLMSMYVWHGLWHIIPENRMLALERIVKKIIYR